MATVPRPNSKKRRVAAQVEGGGGGNEEPPECLAGGPDLISDLPDAIRATIISLLPTDDGARTQVLSTRWRHLWCSSPLNLCDGDNRGFSNCDVTAVVSRVLSTHRGPVRRLSLGCPWFRIVYPDLDSWLRSLAFNNLQELELWQSFTRPDPMPPAAFLLSSSLRVLALSTGDDLSYDGKYVKFPADDVDRLHFPNLKQLTIKCMIIAESTLHTLLSKCPVLESLVLSENVGFHRLRIISPTLRSFGLSVFLPKKLLDLGSPKEVIIEDAPLLERFFIPVPYLSEEDGVSVRISGTPKLQFLGSLMHGITTLELGSTTISKETMPVNSTVVVRTVKVLVVHMSPPSIDDVIGLMKCFPCLQKLYVKFSLKDSSKRVQHHNPLDYLECLDLHLKKLVLINYQGRKRDVEFANFFLLNAKVLEMMELVTLGNRRDSKYLIRHHKLQLKASKDTQVLITGDNVRYSVMRIRSMHDMSIGDPYDKSLCSFKSSQCL